MRIVLVTPTLSDPAHRRVSSSLVRAYRRLGQDAWAFAPGRLPARELAAVLRRRSAEVCHVQWFSRGLAWLSGVRLPAGTRLVVTHQGASTEFLEQRDIFRKVTRKADAVTTVSKHGARELKAAFGWKRAPAVVLNGAEPASPGARPRRKRPYVLAVSRLAAYKGIDVLGMAFADLAARAPDLDLLICGPDQTGGRLPRFLASLRLGSRLRWLGELSPERLRPLLRGCAAFVLPSRRENLPMALLEAMAEGKPCVAAAVGGVPEVLRHRREGLLVPPERPAALARALHHLIIDPGLGRRLGAAARSRAGRWTWDAAALGYVRVFDRLKGQ